MIDVPRTALYIKFLCIQNNKINLLYWGFIYCMHLLFCKKTYKEKIGQYDLNRITNDTLNLFRIGISLIDFVCLCKMFRGLFLFVWKFHVWIWIRSREYRFENKYFEQILKTTIRIAALQTHSMWRIKYINKWCKCSY